MDVLTICAALAVTTFLSVMLRQTRPEWALGLGLVAGVGASLVAVSTLFSAIDTVRALLEKAAVGGETILLLLKSLGICLLTQFTADVCRDAGETALASRAEFAGKVALFVLALPLFERLVSLSLSLMEGGAG